MDPMKRGAGGGRCTRTPAPPADLRRATTVTSSRKAEGSPSYPLVTSFAAAVAPYRAHVLYLDPAVPVHTVEAVPIVGWGVLRRDYHGRPDVTVEAMVQIWPGGSELIGVSEYASECTNAFLLGVWPEGEGPTDEDVRRALGYLVARVVRERVGGAA